MKSFKFTCCAIALMTYFVSCSKTNSEGSTDQLTAVIESGDWKITTVNIAPAFYGTTDFLATLPACEKDNLFQFRSAGAFYHDEGMTKCDLLTAQRDTGTWRYDPNDKVLRFSSPAALTKTLVIKNIASASFSGEDAQTINGVVYTFSVAFTRQ